VFSGLKFIPPIRVSVQFEAIIPGMFQISATGALGSIRGRGSHLGRGYVLISAQR